MSSVSGTVSVPVMVPPPPDNVIVNGAFAFCPVMLFTEADDVNVPFPIFVNVAVPLAVNVPVATASVPVASTVKVVLIVSACAPAQRHRTNARLVRVWIICWMGPLSDGEPLLTIHRRPQR